MTQKFVMGSPLYRQEQELNRQGIPLSRQTISNWMLRASKDYLSPVYEQLHLFIALHHIPVGAVSSGNADLGQNIREADILDTIEIAVGGNAQRAGKLGFSNASRTHDEHVVCFLNISTGGQTEDLPFAQPSVRMERNILNAGPRLGVPRLLDQSGKAITVLGCPFCIHEHRESVFKKQALVGVVSLLPLKAGCHRVKPHFIQLSKRFVSQHHSSLL